MHTIKGGWIGQTFALSTSNDSGGKKSRIRRSKEERKIMVESFIKKYQKSNNGNFPSLNLTHKEVGGSFYIVREIVREIIQENRVLAPPKGSKAEQDHSGVLEQPNLGFIPVEHKKEFSASDKLHIATSILPNQYQVTSGEHNSNSSLQFLAPELNDEQSCDELSTVDETENVSEEASHLVPNHHQDTEIEDGSNFDGLLHLPRSDEFEIEKIVNRGEELEEDIDYGKTSIKNGTLVHDLENGYECTLQSTDKRYPNKHEKIIDETKEAEQEVVTLSLDQETLSSEEFGGQYVEPSSVTTSFTNTDGMVEAFPLSPISWTILDSDGESGELIAADETSENTVNKDANTEFVSSNIDLVNTKSEEMHATLISPDKRKDEKVALNLHEHDVDDVNDSTSKNSSSDDFKAKKSGIQVIPKGSTAAAVESSNQENDGLKKMNRINLETWEGTSKKSAGSESNPVLAFVKAFISAFVKFWSE